jgi:hypothetical protein
MKVHAKTGRRRLDSATAGLNSALYEYVYPILVVQNQNHPPIKVLPKMQCKYFFKYVAGIVEHKDFIYFWCILRFS